MLSNNVLTVKPEDVNKLAAIELNAGMMHVINANGYAFTSKCLTEADLESLNLLGCKCFGLNSYADFMDTWVSETGMTEWDELSGSEYLICQSEEQYKIMDDRGREIDCSPILNKADLYEYISRYMD